MKQKRKKLKRKLDQKKQTKVRNLKKKDKELIHGDERIIGEKDEKEEKPKEKIKHKSKIIKLDQTKPEEKVVRRKEKRVTFEDKIVKKEENQKKRNN